MTGSVQHDLSEGNHVLALPPVIGPAQTEDITAQLRKMILLDKPIQVDASRVVHVSTLGLQVLLSVAQSCSKRRLSFLVVKPSQKFVRACDLLGLSGLLQPSMTEASS